MDRNTNETTRSRWQLFMRSDVNGLLVVIGVLIAMMLLPGPTEAEFQARDVKMNDMVTVEDLRK